MQSRHIHKNQSHVLSRRENKLQLQVKVRYSEPHRTFTVGVIVSQWAEAILTNAAVSCLQVHAVRVLHAAMALWAEVVTCRRDAEEKVDTQNEWRGEQWWRHSEAEERSLCTVTTFPHIILSAVEKYQFAIISLHFLRVTRGIITVFRLDPPFTHLFSSQQNKKTK